MSLPLFPPCHNSHCPSSCSLAKKKPAFVRSGRWGEPRSNPSSSPRLFFPLLFFPCFLFGGELPILLLPHFLLEKKKERRRSPFSRSFSSHFSSPFLFSFFSPSLSHPSSGEKGSSGSMIEAASHSPHFFPRASCRLAPTLDPLLW